ncbi:hypothetical protein CBS101457_001477 [Exobasidium rhododendri]|nr:hypothetical protein CBS101457_001477 [Exobasidium rhododendri]
MKYDSPFGSPFGSRERRQVPQDENSVRFAILKPLCVELLGRLTPQSSPANSLEATHGSLKRLYDALTDLVSTSPESVPLSPSLINYIFFPLAQLLRVNPKEGAELPDRIRHATFQILTLLAIDWWRIWTECIVQKSGDASKRTEQWKVWEQLLILGAVALGGPPDGKTKPQRTSSDETQAAVSSFLQELLLPRMVSSVSKPPASSSSFEPKPKTEWEWDGEEELPSLDDFDHFQRVSGPNNGREGLSKEIDAATAILRQVYPCSAHLEHNYANAACRGAIAHALTASLDVASDHEASSANRIASVKIARLLIGYWVAGGTPKIDELSSLWRKVSAAEMTTRSDRQESSTLLHSITQADRVAIFLPGCVSSMVRILTTATAKRTKSEVICQTLLSFDTILQLCLCDDAIAEIVTSMQASGEEVASQPLSIEELVARENMYDTAGAPTSTTIGDVEVKIEARETEAIGRNRAWLENTISHIVIGLLSLDPLSHRTHSQVQVTIVYLAYNLLARCHMMLDLQREALKEAGQEGLESVDATRLLLRWIVDVVASTSSSSVAKEQAESSLRSLFAIKMRRGDAYQAAVQEEVLSLVRSLPRLLGSQKDEDVERNAKRLAFLLCLSGSGFDSTMPVLQGVKGLLHPSSGVERWGPTLLWSLQIDERKPLEEGTTSIRLQGLAAASSKAVLEVFVELGRASARVLKEDCYAKSELSKPFHLLWYFVNQAASHRSTEMDRSSTTQHNRHFTQSALIVVDGMMKGIAEVLDDSLLSLETTKGGKRLRKSAHRLSKDLLERITEFWEEDEEELLQTDLEQERVVLSEEETRLIAPGQQEHTEMEYSRGVSGQEGTAFERPSNFGPALQLDFVSSASLTSRKGTRVLPLSHQQVLETAKAQLDRSDAFLLSILSSTCKILGPLLKPALLQILYPVICGIASHSTMIGETAVEAMEEMARSAGYASVQGCVSDHADYVLGIASHRLISTLGQELQALSLRESVGVIATYVPLISAQSAPLVLVEIIRMLGGEALTLIQDAIDEVLDAIDRFHLHSIICDNLLTVLDRLVEVMVIDERSKTKEKEGGRTIPNTPSNAAMIAFQPNEERDLEELKRWYLDRKISPDDRRADSTEAPLFDKTTEETGEEGHGESQKPNAGQLVVVSILEKAIPFLSHSSAVVRIRCLRLLNRGTELLCLQERTIEPLQVINAAWPSIMSRLGFSLSLSLRRFDRVAVPAYEDLSEKDFSTCIEAAKLVTTLARFLVDYLGSKKLLRQAVPRLLLLLKILERGEGREGAKQSTQNTFVLKELSRSTVEVSTSLTRLPAFQPVRPFTPLYTLLQNVFSTLDTLVKAMGPQMTEADLLEFALHPTLLSCLDRRQEMELRTISSHFYHSTLCNRNENLVWLVLNGARDRGNSFPAFLHCPHLELD